MHRSTEERLRAFFEREAQSTEGCVTYCAERVTETRNNS